MTAATKRKTDAPPPADAADRAAPAPQAAPDAADAPPHVAGRLHKSATIARLACALARAQAELQNPPLDEEADTGKYKYRYVSLATVRDTITPVFARHGLAVMQLPGTGQRGPTVTTLLLHESGEWVESEPLEIPAAKSDAQCWGSAITYARRYALLALANVVGDADDDAQAAAAPPRQQAKARPPIPAAEFARRLHEYDLKLAAEGLCKPGELANAVALRGQALGAPADLTLWDSVQIEQGRAATRAFVERCRQGAPKQAS